MSNIVAENQGTDNPEALQGRAFGLFSYHYQEWKDSAVSDLIIQRNVESIEDSFKLKELLNYKPSQKWKHPDNLIPGWGVTGVDPTTGEPTDNGFQFKPDSPPLDEKGRPRKYLGASKYPATPLFLDTGDHKYWPNTLGDHTIPIIVTEGAKKAGSALTAGFACISLPGVTCGQKLERLKPELESVCALGRKIYLAFDRDLLTKPHVARALDTLGRLLAAQGCVIFILEWPDQYKGLDDWLVQCTDPAGSLSLAMEKARTFKEWRNDTTEEEAPDDCGLRKLFGKISGLLANSIKWNELTHTLELDGRPLEQELLRLHLAIAFNLDVGRRDAEMICLYLAKQNAYHPIRDYLHQTHQDNPTPPDFLDTISQEILGTNDPIHTAYIRKFLISCVARVMRPGCKVDSVLILQGAQGAGKSSFFRLLCPDPAWFDDSFGAQSDKDERLKLHESWICEWGELESVFRRKDLSALKSFITCQTDKIRPPYAHKAESFHRPSVLVGSTNQSEFLADSTGNRRFHVIPVPGDIDLERLVSWRDRIWAAAMAAFLSGEKWELPADLRQGSAAQAEEFEFSDSWDTAIASWIRGQENDGFAVRGQLFTVGELMDKALGIPPERQTRPDQMRVADCLKRLGWEKTRQQTRPDGVRSRFWVLPEKKVSEQVVQDVQVVQQSLEPSQGEGYSAEQPQSTPAEQPQNLPQVVQYPSVEVVQHPNPVTATVSATAEQPAPPAPPQIKTIFHPSSVGQVCRYVGPNPPQVKGLDRLFVHSVDLDRGTATVTAPRWVVDKIFPLNHLEVIG